MRRLFPLGGGRMLIPGIKQPDILPIDGTLRLRKFDGRFDFAFTWYQDMERFGWETEDTVAEALGEKSLPPL